MNYKILLAAPLAAFLGSVSAKVLKTPDNWGAVSQNNSRSGWYEWGVDTQQLRDGQFVMTMRSFDQPPPGSIAATYTEGYNYQGQRVRLSGWMRGKDVSGWGGVYLGTRLDGEPWAADAKRPLPLATGFGRGNPGDGQWRPFSIVMTVPQDSPTVTVGLLLNGPGEVSISGLRFEPVGPTEAESTERAGVDVEAIRASRKRIAEVQAGNGAPRPPQNLELKP